MVSVRRKKGSAIAFSVVLALVLVVLGIGFFYFSMYMGAQNETKNATDSGALNVGKQVLDGNLVTVNLGASDKEQFFRDVADGTFPLSKINLTNIGRVWGKALLVAINADAAGSAAGSTEANVQAAFDGASSISDKLSDKLKEENNLHTYFEDYSKANSTRMIGADSRVVTLPGDNTWQTSLMDREKESNIEVIKANLPIGYTLPDDYSTKTTRVPAPSGAQNKDFLKGYFPLKVSGQTFWTVPFLYDGKPHLVSKTLFDADKQPPHALPAQWDKAVPNAFSVGGKVATKPGVTSETAMSWVQTNPRKTYPLQFPHGFVRVVLKANTLQWTLMGIDMDSATYESLPGQELESGDGVPYPIPLICETVSASALMVEYAPPTLLSAINSGIPPYLPGSPNGKAMKYILQRCQEMVPTCTMQDLIIACSACTTALGGSGDQNFYIFPSPLGITAVPETLAPFNLGMLGVNRSADPEGTEEWSDSPLIPLGGGFEEFATCNGIPVPIPPLPVKMNIKRSWKPGTGYEQGCLGELTVEHSSTAFLIVVPCTCPPV